MGSSSSEERKEEDMRKQIEERTRWLNNVARKSALIDGALGMGMAMCTERDGSTMFNHQNPKIGTKKQLISKAI